MELELRYKKEMEKYDLKESDLPEDARVGIAEINKVLGAINMIEKKGESPKPKTIQKVKTMDKWVSFEILDHVHDTSKNTDDSGVDVDEVIEEIEEQVDDNEGGSDNADELGSKVAVELKKLSESGKDTFTIDEIKSHAKNAYDVIFDTYEDGGKNGVETNDYSLIETGDQEYTLKQK